MVLSEAEGLLLLAAMDLETAEASSDPLVFREGAWGFWMQQSVEKALKAWLVLLGETPPLTHDLNRLLLLLEVHGVNSSPFHGLSQFTIYAVQFLHGQTPPLTHDLNRLLLRIGGQPDTTQLQSCSEEYSPGKAIGTEITTSETPAVPLSNCRNQHMGFNSPGISVRKAANQENRHLQPLECTIPRNWK
jgi:HEPN domain-containing protein